jgi:hypothetical protein
MFSLDKLKVYDKARTNAASLVLNIAEANGRYAPGERRSLFEHKGTGR